VAEEAARTGDLPSAFPARLIAALALSSTLGPLNSTMVSVALPSIGPDLETDATLLRQTVVTSYLITSVVVQAPAGKLGDRWGHRRALAVGQALFAFGSIAAALAPSVAVLSIARIAMAAGASMIIPSAGALLRLELPIERRGRAFGMFGASMALAAAIGPLLGGALLRVGSWRALFVVNLVILPVAALLAASDRTPRSAPLAPSDSGFDILGSVLLGASLTCFVLGTSAPSQWRMLSIAVGALLVIAFVQWEKRQRDPVVDPKLFRNRVFVAGGGIIALQNLPMYALLFELPSLLGTVLRVDSHRTGPLLGTMMVAMVVASPISGRLTDRIGARIVAGVGTLTSLLGAAVMLMTELRTPMSYAPSLVLFGLGLGLSASPSQAAAMNVVARESSGAASGVLATMRYVGGIAGMLILGAFFHGSDVPSVAIAEHRFVLMVFTASLAIAFGCSMVLPGRPATSVERGAG